MNEKNSKKQVDSQFVCKLCDMMEKHPKIVNWDQKGERMIVSSVGQLQKIVLPQYFRHSNFASFIRQLNMYDFHKLQKDEITNESLIAFEHSIFKKGNQRNFHFIQRKKKNKQHETTIIQFQKKYQNLIQRINTHARFSEDTKKSIFKLIEFRFIATQNTKKIKNQIENVYKDLKDCRSKKISHTINQMKEKLTQEMNEQISMSKIIDRYLQGLFSPQKQNQQNRANQYSSNYYSSILSKDTCSIPQVVFDCRNLNQKANFFILPSHCGFLSQMSGHDLSNTHPLFFSNPQFYSDMNNQSKALDRKGHLKLQQDEEMSMDIVNEEELANILNEKKQDYEKEILKKQHF